MAPKNDRRSAATVAEDTVRRHLLGVWRYLRSHGARPDQADDLAQECFVIAAQKGALAFEPAATATFLCRTARFLLLRDRRAQHDDHLLADAIDDLWQRECATDGGDERFAALRACLDALTPRTARAVEMAYGLRGEEPASRHEIAAAIGLAENGEKSLMQRARQQLHACLDRTKPRSNRPTTLSNVPANYNSMPCCTRRRVCCPRRTFPIASSTG